MTRLCESWKPGPWDDEPDEHRWKAHGLRCKIVRCPGPGHLCGYVEARGNPFRHSHLPDNYFPEDITGGGPDWLGFDCNHYPVEANPRDISEGRHSSGARGSYRTFEEVKERTEVLALFVRRQTVWWRRLLRYLAHALVTMANNRFARKLGP